MPVDFSRLRSPILFPGDARTAWRDPAVFYHNGMFHLFTTVSTIDPDGLVYWQTAWSKSADLIRWTVPQWFTPKDRALNFSSPGNVVRDGDAFVLCLQTYPTPRPTDQYGDATCRIWTRRSPDLEQWGEPELLRVEGPDVPPERMARLIDPYLLDDRARSGAWWCFYKKGGQVCCSRSMDLMHWEPLGSIAGGENPCVVPDRSGYVLFYSPATGVGVKRSDDLKTWRDCGLLRLGGAAWDWARGRLSGGFVLDLRQEPGIGKALLFFHGSRWPEEDPRGGWANWVSLGIAWSQDLREWVWPGEAGAPDAAAATASGGGDAACTSSM